MFKLCTERRFTYLANGNANIYRERHLGAAIPELYEFYRGASSFYPGDALAPRERRQVEGAFPIELQHKSPVYLCNKGHIFHLC